MKCSPQVRCGNAANTPGRLMKTAINLIAVFIMAAVVPAAFAGVEEGRLKAQVCTVCHGVDGNSPTAVVPSIAGQPRQFIVTALYMFREGRRSSTLMAPFAEKLSNADLNDLAAWFSAQKLAPPAKKPTPENVALGKAITEKNNCVACHTATLVGQQHIPRLAGQHYDYLLAQLKQFKASTRGDFDGTMTSAAQALSAADIDVLAEYLSTLAVP
jgi:cytochrome c553